MDQLNTAQSGPLSVSQYSESPSEVSVELADEASLLRTAHSYLSQYSQPASEVSVEVGGMLKGLTGPLPDPVPLTDLLQTAASELSTADEQQLVSAEQLDLLEQGLLTDADLLTCWPESGAEPADLDLLMQTASSDVSTAALAGDLDECSFKTAGSADFDQHQKLAHLDDFLHTAASELSTGAQRTDSVLTGLAELSISDYSAPASETFLDDVEAELYPQAYKPLLHLPQRRGVDTPKPEELDLDIEHMPIV